MNELALFAGAGGGILGGALLGWNCIGAVEIERYPREVLLQRQRDGILPKFPIWDDVRTFDGKPWRGLVDVVSGGFPCQDISSAGRGAGITGERSGLWKEMWRIIGEVRPRFAFLENSPMLASRGLGTVLGDLAEIGYDAAWMCLSASDCGAPHKRERMWVLAEDVANTRIIGRTGESNPATGDIETLGQPQQSHAEPDNTGLCRGSADVAHTASGGQAIRLQADAREHSEKSGTAPAEPGARCTAPAHPHMPGCQEQRRGQPAGAQHETAQCGGWWSAEPRLGRVADGVANRVDRLKALGNGQVPIVAATAYNELRKLLKEKGFKK